MRASSKYRNHSSPWDNRASRRYSSNVITGRLATTFSPRSGVDVRPVSPGGVHHVHCPFAQGSAGGPGRATHDVKGFLLAHLVALHDDPLGLGDDLPSPQRTLEPTGHLVVGVVH